MLIFDFKTLKDYYDRGMWTKEMLWNAVRLGKITKEDYKVITGDDYPVISPPKEIQPALRPKQ